MVNTGGKDLFGDPVERKTFGIGYAAAPGSGPDGETCGTCHYFYRHDYHGKTYFKCSHPMGHMSLSEATDIRKSSLACSYWEAPD